jgi:hypothetical protein
MFKKKYITIYNEGNNVELLLLLSTLVVGVEMLAKTFFFFSSLNDDVYCRIRLRV